MLLAIDIGNTNVTLGLWDGMAWREQWRLRTVHEKTVDEYWIDLRTLLSDGDLLAQLRHVVISSVVPPLTATFASLCSRHLRLPLLQVNHRTPMGITIQTDNPAEVGADRLVNAAAVAHLYQGAVIVIDMGTATTFDLVSADRALLGVVIAPGLRLAADALASRAAQLSRVALTTPPRVLGKNTTHSVQSGLIYGYVSLVEGVVQRLKEEYWAEIGRNEPIAVVGTGGLISLIQPLTAVITHCDPWLTLSGLRIIWELNA